MQYLHSIRIIFYNTRKFARIFVVKKNNVEIPDKNFREWRFTEQIVLQVFLWKFYPNPSTTICKDFGDSFN